MVIILILFNNSIDPLEKDERIGDISLDKSDIPINWECDLTIVSQLLLKNLCIEKLIPFLLRKLHISKVIYQALVII